MVPGAIPVAQQAAPAYPLPSLVSQLVAGSSPAISASQLQISRPPLPPPPPVPLLRSSPLPGNGPSLRPVGPVQPLQQQQQHVQQLQQAQQAQQSQQIWPRAATPRTVSQGLEDERLVGRIKRYVDMPGGGGYGFIDCEDTKLRFSRDVYIHKNQMHGLAIGDSVSFTIVRNNKGEPHARNVMRNEDALMLRPGAQQQAGDAWRGAAPKAAPPVGVPTVSAAQGAASLMDERQA